MSLSADCLTTLATVKDELQIAQDDTSYDATLERYVEQVSADWVTLALGRKFHYAAVVEYHAGYGTPNLHLKRYPIVEVTSVEYNGVLIDASTYVVPTDEEDSNLYRKVGWPWTAVRVDGVTRDVLPGDEERAIKATYSGGYVTPEQERIDATLTRTLPADIEGKIIEGVVIKFRGRGVDKSMTSSRLTGASTTWERGALGYPPWFEEAALRWTGGSQA